MEKFDIIEDGNGLTVIDNITRTAHIGFRSREDAENFINNKYKKNEEKTLQELSDAGVQFQVRRGCTNCTDGTVVYQGRTGVGSVTDPINYTLTTIISASNNDTLTICARDFVTGSGNKVYIDNPSWFYLYRIDTYIPDEDLFPFKQTAGSASYDANYTINSYQISNQYTRATEQVPFYLGTPGPLSIRGRTNTGSVIFTS